MRFTIPLAAAALLLIAGGALAASFVVPTDEELVAKSSAIAIGTVEGSFVQETDGLIQTVYEIRIERAIKGLAALELVRVYTYGGVLGDRALLVPGEARFEQGERVLLFLTPNKGRWRTTDLTLGKFRFTTSTRGERLLVRDTEDVVGWDHAGQVHHEPVRREAGFLRFIEERVRGRAAADDYTVDSAEVTLAPAKTSDPFGGITANAPFPAATYSDWSSTGMPYRWQNAAATFSKRADQNIPGAADGGVSTIQNALAAWTNDCASAVVLTYGGQQQRVSTVDGFNTVEFNDPQQRIGGSFTGAGTVALTFMVFSGTHPFASGTWSNLYEADVVFQDGYTAGNASFPAAMTHEIGHGIGFRHSDQNHQTRGACNSSIEECTSAAIMNSSSSGAFGFTLQTWDLNAVQSIYPGGSCGPACTPPSISAQPSGGTVAPGAARTLSVTAGGTAPLSYQWYIGPSGDTTNPIPWGTGSSITVSPGTTTSYWVRVSNSCGSANSAAATVTVTVGTAASGAASGLFLVTPCRTIDTRGGNANPGGSVQIVQITGRCGIPSTARAVAINITALAPAGTGFMTVYPGTGAAPPGASAISYRLNKTRANNAVIRLSSDGKLGVYNSGPATHFIIDVTGYFQ